MQSHKSKKQNAPAAADLVLAWHQQMGNAQDALDADPHVDYLAEGIIETGSLSIVYGAPSTLKTMLLLDLAACVAAGKPWLADVFGQGGIQTLQARVLWLDADNGQRRIVERKAAIMRGHGLGGGIGFYHLSMPNPPFFASDPEAVAALQDTLIGHDIGLLVIDNLGLIAGSIEENSAGMAQVMGNLRSICERTGAAIILIHHQRKSNGISGQGRAGDSLRGHSSIEAALDLALLAMRQGVDPKIRIVPTKTRGASVAPFDAEFVHTHKPNTRTLEKAHFMGGAADTLTQTILDLLDDAGGMLARTALVQAAKARQGIRESTVRDRLDEMIGLGELHEEKAGRIKQIMTPDFWRAQQGGMP